MTEPGEPHPFENLTYGSNEHAKCWAAIDIPLAKGMALVVVYSVFATHDTPMQRCNPTPKNQRPVLG
jgi:hypothetical protein